MNTLNSSNISKLYKKYEVPANIIAHMKKVSEFAAILCDKFTKKGYKIDKESVVKAALVHDLLRVCDFKEISPTSPVLWAELKKKYGKLGHEKATQKILNKMGHKEIGNLVLKHDFFKIKELRTWEEKILYYADKRVDHDKVVSLKVRFREGRKRNFSDTDDLAKITATEKMIVSLEKQIRKTIK